jgi:hypothetical protein
MSTTRAFYCVVQFVPDPGRAEAANAGVVLFVPSLQWLEIRVSPTLERVRQFFRPDRHELTRIQMALESLKHRMELARGEFASEEELAQFVAARADAMRLTAPRLVKVREPYSDLHALYEKLVGDFERTRVAPSPLSLLPRQVAETFGRLEGLGKLWRPLAIQVPTLKRQFDVAAAYENGRTNYVRLESLTPGKRLGSRMQSLGFHGRLIYQHPIDGKESQLVVMSASPEADPADEARFASTLRDFDVRFVPHRQAEEFAQEVERTAH